MDHMEPDPITIGPEAGQNISIVGDTYRILMSGKQTGGAFATIDMLIPPGSGPGPHAHAHFHETFYVLDGEVEVRSTAGVYTAKKGSYVVIPKGGIVHNFKNKTNRVAHLRQSQKNMVRNCIRRITWIENFTITHVMG